MTLPSEVAAAWNAFADAIDVSSMQEADYVRFTDVAVAAHAAGVGLDALQDPIIDVASKDGAPDFLGGELTMGLDIALRALAAHAASATSGVGAAAAAAAAAAAVAKEAEARAAAEAAAAAKAAEEARSAALSKLSPEERKALGLS